jgi:hypothetical protein
VNRWLELLLETVADQKIIVVGPRPHVIGPTPSTTVAPPARLAWDEKRWEQRGSGDRLELVGQYRVFDRRRQAWRAFHGRLFQQGRTIATYIADPPAEVKQHRHGACLQLVEAPWFLLHWNRPPHTLDDGLLYMERMLDESINAKGR